DWPTLVPNRWGEHNASPQRQSRLRRLVDLAHSYGLLAGADIPIGLRQQHAWYMVRTKDDVPEQKEGIQRRCSWAAGAGFDFLSTEAGTSEFTNQGAGLMLDLFNTFSEHVNGTLGMEAHVKV
ncbi:unnamed protein product, partial [Discosporangium mesarthrocarpum]